MFASPLLLPRRMLHVASLQPDVHCLEQEMFLARALQGRIAVILLHRTQQANLMIQSLASSEASSCAPCLAGKAAVARG